MAAGKASKAGKAGAAPKTTKGDKACKVYVGNLSYKTNWHSLKDFFEGKAAKVVYSKVMREDSPNGKEGAWSKGYGFVEFSTPQEAEMVIAAFDGTEVDGRNIKLGKWESDGTGASGGKADSEGGKWVFVKADSGFQRAGSSFQKARGSFQKGGGWSSPGKGGVPAERRGNPECKVYVGQLSYKTNWISLKEFFESKSTSVVYSKVMREDAPNGKEGAWSKGYGFIEFSTPQEAQMVISKFDGTEIDGRAVKLDQWNRGQ
mmetsp:Transcript_14272/g.39398  ORF Transcript_14272/g.39398 Transcript_14272/m.39398 type:complete len:260 (-) Transcript_14272:209-988(-)